MFQKLRRCLYTPLMIYRTPVERVGIFRYLEVHITIKGEQALA